MKSKSRLSKADGEPLEPNSVDEGEAEVAVAEVEGEPLGSSSADEGEGEVAVEAEMTSTRQGSFARRCWSPGPPMAPLVRSSWWRQYGSDEVHFKRRSEFNMVTQARSQQNSSDTSRTQKVSA